MRYVVELPDEIEQALEKRASATGDEVAHLIEAAIAAFFRNGAQASASGRRLCPNPVNERYLESCPICPEMP